MAVLNTRGDALSVPHHSVSPAGFITDWVLVGPFVTAEPLVNPKTIGDTGRFDRDFLVTLGGEAEAVISPGLTVAYEAAPGRQRAARAQRVSLALDDPERPDLKHILDDRHVLEQDYDQAVGYACCYLESETAQAVHAYLGTDGATKVFLNGELIHEVREQRKTTPWKDRLLLHLQPGANRLLIKVDNRTDWWGLQIAVFTEREHEQAIRLARPALTIEEITHEQGNLAITVGSAPSSLELRLPVQVRVETREGAVIAAGSGMTGEPTVLPLPIDAAGSLIVRATPAPGVPYEMREKAQLFCTGDLRDTARSLRQRYASDVDRSSLPEHWHPVYAGAIAWVRDFLQGDFASAEPWAIRSLEYAANLRDALEDGRNYLAEHADKAFPVLLDVIDTNGDAQRGHYLVTLPPAMQAATRYPLLLNLHGSSAVVKKITFGDANIPQFAGVWPEVIAVSPMAPHPLTALQGWQVPFLNAVLAHVKEHFPVDDDRVYLQGGSGGGKGTWNWVHANPEHFAAACVLCGGDGYPFRAARLKNLPIWTYNGEKDLASHAFMPELMVSAICRAGGEAGFTILPEEAHAISHAIDKEAWRDWYLQHTRCPLPVPADPLDALGIGSDGVSEVTIVDVPEMCCLTLADGERLDYPQDNVYRSTVRLFQAYRKPRGLQPQRAGDGRYFLRSTEAAVDGPMQMLLDAPEMVEAEGILEAVTVPAFRAARVYVRCWATWDALKAQQDAIYARLDAQGYQRTGEERAYPLTVMDHEGIRLWELQIGIR